LPPEMAPNGGSGGRGGNSLAEPLLGRRSGGGRQQDAANSGGIFAPGSMLSCIVLMASASIGTGGLALPYGVSLTGLLPAAALFVLAGVMTLVSNVILFLCVRKTGVGTYGELMVRVLGARGAMVLDLMVCLEGMGAVATYIVFIMDYVPQLCALAGEDTWCTEPVSVAMAASVIIWPLSCLRGLNALRYVSTCSLVTLAFTAAVVIVKAPGLFARTGVSFAEAASEVKLNGGAFQVLSMACFAFCIHTNTPEIAYAMRKPTQSRTFGAVSFYTALMFASYFAIAMCGFLSFMWEVNQDFLTNYDIWDSLIITCRCMLSVTLVFACPINLCPGIQALFNILESLLNSEAAAASAGTSRSGESKPRLYENDVLRIPVTTGCFFISLGVALKSPHVADLIGTVSTFLSSPLMFTFPAMMYRVILQRKDVLIPAMLHALTAALWVAEIYRLLSPP